MSIVSHLLKPGLNHRTGRRADPDMIVIHVTEGSAASVIAWFDDPAAQVSANYMVQKDGLIIQFVSEKDEAWAQGRVDHPTAKLVKARTLNPNSYCISIEHEGDGLHELTDAQRAASIGLIREIAQRHGIPLDRDHVVGHHEIYSLKTCPGKIDVDRLVHDALAAKAPVSDPPAIAPEPPIVWSAFLNDWLVVVKVTSDRDWYFVPLSEVKKDTVPTPASALLSQMPTRRS